MAKHFEGITRYILFVQVLALLMNVCFAFPPLPLSEKRPRLPRSSSECTLTLYDGDIGSSPSFELTTTDSSLADNGWNNRASSAIVSGGCQWILYDGDVASSGAAVVSFSSSVIGPGSYTFSTFRLPDNSVSAVRCLPAEGTSAVILFEHSHYFGQMQVIKSSSSNLALINFDNQASAIIITGGTWELYSQVNYAGSTLTLGQGLYRTPSFLRPIGNDGLTSMRLIATADCGPPTVIFNGTVSYLNTTEGSEAQYLCDDGFTLEGEMTAVCRSDQRWSSTPVCRQTTVDCGPPPVFRNGTVSYQNTTEGSEAHYHCDDGFTLEGEMTAVCRADGRWSSTPVCGPLTVDCGPPPVFRNGIVSYQNTTERSEAHYHCDDGFTLEGEMTAVCRADGRWSSTPVCGPSNGGSNNSTASIQGIGNTTITAIIVPLSCVVFFIIGVLVGAMVTYCALKKKHAVDMRQEPTVVLSQLNEEPDPKYEDISDLQSPGNIDLKENAAYISYVQH